MRASNATNRKFFYLGTATNANGSVSAYGKLYLNDLVFLYWLRCSSYFKITCKRKLLSLVQSSCNRCVAGLRSVYGAVRKQISNLKPNGLELTLHTHRIWESLLPSISVIWFQESVDTQPVEKETIKHHIQMRTNKTESRLHRDWQPSSFFRSDSTPSTDVLIWKIQSDYNLNALSSKRRNERVLKQAWMENWFEQFLPIKRN